MRAGAEPVRIRARSRQAQSRGRDSDVAARLASQPGRRDARTTRATGNTDSIALFSTIGNVISGCDDLSCGGKKIPKQRLTADVESFREKRFRCSRLLPYLGGSPLVRP